MSTGASTMTKGKVNPISAAGFGAGNSELYDKARPSVATEALSHIRKAAPKKDGLRIVELGSGSGILTRGLLAHPEWSSAIAEMRCIDPNEGMRAVFSQQVSDSRVSLADGTFDDTGVPDGWADVIVAASAFHWCSNLEEAAIEFARIAAPECTIAFLWTETDREVPWIAQTLAIAAPYYPSRTETNSARGAWRQIFSLPTYTSNFEPPTDETIRTIATGTRASVTAYLLSASGIAVLPSDDKAKVATKVAEVLEKGEGLVWQDKEKGEFEQPFATHFVIMKRKLA